MLVPTSQDEPALQDALNTMVLKLVLGVLGSAGLAIDDRLGASIAVAVAALVAAVLSYVQGRTTRGKVYAPTTVADSIPGGVGWPTDVQLPAELTVTDAPLDPAE